MVCSRYQLSGRMPWRLARATRRAGHWVCESYRGTNAAEQLKRWPAEPTDAAAFNLGLTTERLDVVVREIASPSTNDHRMAMSWL